MKYRLISDPDPKYFEDMVNSLLTNGWELYGNPFVMLDGTLKVFSQAMIKKGE
jgi:hypothetical protein